MNNTTYSLRFGGELMSLDRPKVMGIINVTPDSFYDGGKTFSVKNALLQAQSMLEAGADFLDIGACSTRPGAEIPSLTEEKSRLLPVVKAIKEKFPASLVSVDTFRAEVAHSALETGADLINDVSAGDGDPEMFPLLRQVNVPYIFMHKKGMPKTMQDSPNYGNVLLEVAEYLSHKILELNQLGVHDIIADPGFGFGKSLDHNYELLCQLDHFKILDVPFLIGLSRKRMVYNLLDTTPDQALNGTSVLHFKALQGGANILRVHDVREAKEVVALFEKMQEVEERME